MTEHSSVPKSFAASLRVSFNLSRCCRMCSPSVVGAGSRSFGFRHLSRTGTSGKKAINPCDCGFLGHYNGRCRCTLTKSPDLARGSPGCWPTASTSRWKPAHRESELTGPRAFGSHTRTPARGSTRGPIKRGAMRTPRSGEMAPTHVPGAVFGGLFTARALRRAPVLAVLGVRRWRTRKTARNR
jgi:hypothetical protein